MPIQRIQPINIFISLKLRSSQRSFFCFRLAELLIEALAFIFVQDRILLIRLWGKIKEKNLNGDEEWVSSQFWGPVKASKFPSQRFERVDRYLLQLYLEVLDLGLSSSSSDSSNSLRSISSSESSDSERQYSSLFISYFIYYWNIFTAYV